MTDWQPGQALYDPHTQSAEHQRPILELIPDHDCQHHSGQCLTLHSGPAARWPEPLPQHRLET